MSVQVSSTGRARTAVAAVAVVVIALVALAVAGAVGVGTPQAAREPDVHASPNSSPGPIVWTQPPEPTNAPAALVKELPPLPSTAEPDTYAAAIAELLFGMDQRRFDREDYLDVLASARSANADVLIPELTDEAFLGALQQRIPDAYMWQRMRESRQHAKFEVSEVWEPDYVAAKRANRSLPDGVVGLNVTGTQTIYYLDENSEPAQRERPQSVSLLLACEPAEPECRLIAVSTGVVA